MDPVVGGTILYKSLESYGLIGAVCAALVGIVVWQAKVIRDMTIANADKNEKIIEKYATLAGAVTAALDKFAGATEDRNNVTSELSKAVSLLGEATKLQTSTTEQSFARVLDRLGTQRGA